MFWFKFSHYLNIARESQHVRSAANDRKAEASTRASHPSHITAAGDTAKVGDIKRVAIRPNGVEITYIGDTRLPVTKPDFTAST